MDSVERKINDLNALLNQQEKVSADWSSLLESLKNKHKLRFILVDLVKYNEESMYKHQLKKLEAVKDQNFEYAAVYRARERECIEHLELASSLSITKPCFVHDDGFLFFFFYGLSEIEMKIKKKFFETIHSNQ